MARQPLSKFFPTRYGSGMIHTVRETDGDNPAVDSRGLRERVGGSFHDVQISNTELEGLAGANIQLVAAPGALRAIVVDAVYMFLDVTTQKDNSAADGDLNLKYAVGADASAGFNIEADGFTDAAAGDSPRFYGSPYDYVGDSPLVVTPVVNTAVVLDNDGAEFTGGEATLSIRVYYHLIDMAAFT